jgi:hypothetical protein
MDDRSDVVVHVRVRVLVLGVAVVAFIVASV